jgi:hypothetical protein
LNAFGIAGGACLGLALAVLVEYLDKRLKSEADVRAALNLMVLATVPVLEGPRNPRRWRLVAISIMVLLIGSAGVAAVVWRLWN